MGQLRSLVFFFNKAILSVFHFHYSVSITFFQILMSIFLLVLMDRMCIITLPPLSYEKAKQMFPLTFLFFTNVLFGLSALSTTNIPIFTGLRRLTSLFIIIGEYLFLNKTSSTQTIFAVSIMMIGTILATFGDHSFNLSAYVMVFFNNVITTASLICIKQFRHTLNLDPLGMMYYNSLISLPFVLALVVWTEEHIKILQFPDLYSLNFQAAFITSCIQVFFMNYATYLCTVINSPLTTAVTGQIKNVLTTIFGLIIFHDVDFDWFLLIGLTSSILGSAYYSFIKFTETQKG